MEVIRLEFQGIGPFTHHHVIDFRELGQSGLFLLEGPTGSGKTTILDAIVFALYGDVAGADSSKGRIVSTMLDPTREPFVDVVIDSSRGLLRVRRTPDFERPKLRGEGTTTSRATIKLWKLSTPDDRVGVPISTSIAEASEELKQAIGLDKGQFTQTVMLPQGHFATFLRAKPEDRRGVLQDIFGTEFYERFAKKLAELAGEHRRREESACVSVHEVASNYCQVAWYDDASRAAEQIAEQVAFDKARDAMDLHALVAGARARGELLAAQRAHLFAAAEVARHDHEAAADSLHRLQARNERIAEVIELARRHSELQARAEEVHQQEGILAAAERAELVRRPIANRQQALAGLEAATRAQASAFDQVRAGADADLLVGHPTAAELGAHEESARLKAGLLDRLVALEDGLPGRLTAAASQREALLDERKRITEGLEQVQTSRAEACELAARVSALDEVAATLAGTVETLAAATRRQEAAVEVERLTAQLTEARARERVVTADHQEAERRHGVARASWLDGLAGELAGWLVEGRPCAVCGSEVHPAPASTPDDFVGREEVQALAEAKEAAVRKAEEARAVSDRIASQLAGQSALTEGRTAAEAATEQASARERRAVAGRATLEVAGLRRTIESIGEATQATERRLHEGESALAARTGAFQADEGQIVDDMAEVSAGAAGFGSVRARQQALTVRAGAAKQLAGVLSAAATAEAERDRCVLELTAVLNERGFVTAEEAQAAMLAPSERNRLGAEVTSYRQEVALVEAQLADERYAGLAGVAPEDPAPAVLAERVTDEAQRAAHRACGVIDLTVQAAAQAFSDLTAQISALKTVRQTAGPVLRLANLANAGEGNLQQVTLPTYVLLRRFEEVVDLANVRLDAMTGGRYELRRTDEREGRGRRLGLGLEVVDHQARDTTRDPKTLSGGETFMASLALALGLADAVTAEAGGIELRTLFVDEGFGSLDPETLDAVMDQLAALRDGGRCVGVVSHVAEMKQRIADRITVVPGRNGTSTLLCSTDSQALAG